LKITTSLLYSSAFLVMMMSANEGRSEELILWDANNECTRSASGTFDRCKVLPRDDMKIYLTPEKPTGSNNAFIQAMHFKNTITYKYNCAGQYDETHLVSPDMEPLKLSFSAAGIVSQTFPSMAIKDYELVRKSKGFSMVSKNCKIVILGNDTIADNLEPLKLYADSQIEKLNSYTAMISAISNQGDVSGITDALTAGIKLIENDLETIVSDIDDVDFDLGMAEEAQKFVLQTKLEGLKAKKLQSEQALKGLTDAQGVVEVSCVNNECEAALKDVKELVEGQMTTARESVEVDILPWINAEIERLKAKNPGMERALSKILSILQKQINK